MKHRALSLFIVSLLMAGCDFLYGVRRSAPLPVPPDFTCVERVIREAPGVDAVRYSRTAGSQPITWTGLQRPTDLHTFFYGAGDQVLGVLQVSTEYDGRTELSQSFVQINRTPPQEIIDAARPVMLWIEEQLETRCGMSELRAAVREDCPGVECPVLAGPE